jgi:DNA-binding winged helix-turn-helix (wHTH) protein
MSPPELLYFGDFLLDLCNACVWKGHEHLPLTMKAFVVLGYLAMHPNRIVSKTELFAAVWPGVVVSDWALSTCIREIRRVLHDTARPPQLIETVYRRGYRFLPTVTTQPVVSGQSSVASRPKQSSVQSLASKIRILPSAIRNSLDWARS